MDTRLQHLRNLFQEQSLDAALITSVPNIFYLTGYAGFLIEEREAYLFITKTDAYLFTNALYLDEVKQSVRHVTIREINRYQPITKSLEELISKHALKKIGIEDHNLTAAEYKSLSSLPLTIEALNLINLRVRKTPDEIEAIATACAIGDKAFEHIITQIKPGVTEKEVAYGLDLFMKHQLADSSFRSIVAFGKNSALPHHVSNNDRLLPNTCILMDFGVKANNYCSDMSRTVFVGKASDADKKVYETVLEAQKKAITYIEKALAANQEISGAAPDAIAREHIEQQGFPTYPHGLGHGIGIEIHESPRLSPPSQSVLTNGMVFSIEPGIYLVNKMGVRIEDLFAIQENKLVRLTNASSQLIEV